MHDYFMEVVKLQRIDFFLRIVADSECSEEDKALAIQWASELAEELRAAIDNHKIN